jgi:hypothetical protein
MIWWAILGPRGGILRDTVSGSKRESWASARDRWDYPGDLACSCVQVDVVTRERLNSLISLVDAERFEEWRRQLVPIRRPGNPT